MLQKPFFIMLTALLVAGFGPGLFSKEKNPDLASDGEVIPILIGPSEGALSTAPRMPSATRIEAYYDEELLSVCSYLSNAGTSVSVEISNLGTGEVFTFTIPGSGFSACLISGTSGTWFITYTLSNGNVYEGTFTI